MNPFESGNALAADTANILLDHRLVLLLLASSHMAVPSRALLLLGANATIDLHVYLDDCISKHLALCITRDLRLSSDESVKIFSHFLTRSTKSSAASISDFCLQNYQQF